MTAGEPPWGEAAIAVERLPGGEGDIVAQGTLRYVVLAVARLPRASRGKIRVSLPDRGAPPFSYAGDALTALIALLPADNDPSETSRRFKLQLS